MNRKYELMIKYPKQLTARFEYELQDEWVEIIKEAHKLTWEVNVQEIKNQISDFEIKKKNILELAKGEEENE